MVPLKANRLCTMRTPPPTPTEAVNEILAAAITLGSTRGQSHTRGTPTSTGSSYTDTASITPLP